MRRINGRAGLLTVAAAATLVAIGGAAGAGAAGLIDSGDVRNNSLKSEDIENETILSRDVADGTLLLSDLRPSAVDNLKGPKGDKGDSGLNGAYYSVAYYDVGQTNAGAIATVACKTQSDVAISGGVQTLGLDATANSRNTPVSSSFPGRMNWSADPAAPFANRLDGWIVQFGGNAGETADKNPEKVKVWAMCVPGADIPVEQTYLESDD